jgi:hypothetical protein
MKKKEISLVLDNCPAHPKLNLENITLAFIPPNTMSHIQPLNQGIKKTFKTLYRLDTRRKIIQSTDDGLGASSSIAKWVLVLDALLMTMNAWDKVSTTCINNCFKKLG